MQWENSSYNPNKEQKQDLLNRALYSLNGDHASNKRVPLSGQVDSLQQRQQKNRFFGEKATPLDHASIEHRNCKSETRNL